MQPDASSGDRSPETPEAPPSPSNANPPSDFDPPSDSRPRLWWDWSFHSLVVTQFLGAFNDNVYKQIVLLLCLIPATIDSPAQDLQSLAQGLFALPFVLFSGFAGYLSDRNSKRSIIVLAKVAEIVIMAGALFAFRSSGLTLLLVVLFAMGVQSAFFGPSKYGILPELFRDQDMPMVNGMVVMTTFIAIILGSILGGYLLDHFAPPTDPAAVVAANGPIALSRDTSGLWQVSLVCVAIAVLGTLSAAIIRHTAIARPGLPFRWSSLAISSDMVALLRRRPRILGVLLASSLLWGVAAMVQLSMNALGREQLGLNYTRTSLLSAVTTIGIAVGGIVAARLSQHRINFAVTKLGAWGITITFLFLALPGIDRLPGVDLPGIVSVGNWELNLWEIAALIESFVLGVFTSCFVIPLQVFLQVYPPRELKGRVIGTMNLSQWTAILLSQPIYLVASLVFRLPFLNIPPSGMFLVTAAMMLPVALLYRPKPIEPGESASLEN